MIGDPDVVSALESFFEQGWISEVLFEVKSGKEATVYCCRGAAVARHSRGKAGGERLAAKVYRPIESRRFKNDSIYQAGRAHMARDGRVKRAAENKSAFGRKVQYATWLENEWEIMNRLHEAKADVPQPLARAERATENGRTFVQRVAGGHWVNAENPNAIVQLLVQRLP